MWITECDYAVKAVKGSLDLWADKAQKEGHSWEVNEMEDDPVWAAQWQTYSS